DVEPESVEAPEETVDDAPPEDGEQVPVEAAAPLEDPEEHFVVDDDGTPDTTAERPRNGDH
ncbi:hypothetical protein ABQF26_35135, partial [Mycolicibacterium elephantis]